MNIYEASNQWANRPEDERFENLDALFLAAKSMKDHAHQKLIKPNELKAVNVNGELMLQGTKGNPAKISNWGFNQLCALSGAPASYLSKIGSERAALNLTADLSKRSNEINLLINDSKVEGLPMVIRAANGPTFGTIWAADIVLQVAQHLSLDKGWRVPPARPALPNQKGTRPATEQDVLAYGKSGLSIKVGDLVAPAGLYYGPSTGKDLFMFFVNEDRRLKGAEELCRFALIASSEVGASYLWGMFGYYDTVCGNHIIWNASNVMEFKIKHIGDSIYERAFGRMEDSFKSFADSSTVKDGEFLDKAKAYVIAPTKVEVIGKLYEKGFAGKKALTEAYDIAESKPRYGDPRTAWAMMSGLTEYSQTLPFADKRVELDRNAGKILSLAR